MFSKKLLRIGTLLAAGSFSTQAHAAWELASGTITLHPDTGDATVDGLLVYKSINLAGDVVTELRDGAGRVRKRIIGEGPDAIVVTQAFDAAGNLLSRRDATGAGTDYAYDALNRKISETDALIPGKVTAFAYDKADRLISKTDPLGIVTTFEYDPRDRLVKETTPMNATETRVIRYGYDGRGHLTTLIDANGAVTTWEYDAAGRNVSKTYPNGDHRTMEYDAASRLVKITDENGGIITSIYDGIGRLTAKHYSKDNSTDTFVYDAASRIVSATKGRYGHTLTYTYDTAGRLATETHPDGAVTRFAYDLANHLATLTHTPAGGGAPTQTTLYGFDGRGLLATVSAGDYATRYEYRINGQLASTVAHRTTNPQADLLRADRTYDAGARLLGVANTAANGEQAGVVYTLGNDDQRLTATEETGARWNYTYDQLKQLAGARKTDTNAAVIPPLDQSYGHDPMGNRRTYAEQGKTVAYTTNSANQYVGIAETLAAGALVTQSPVYDHNGNTLADGRFAYTWDADNQLTSATPLNPADGAKKVSFTYDWRGRRTTKAVATLVAGTWQTTGNTDFKYHEWNLIAEKSTDLTTPAAPLATEKRYVWGNDLSGNLHGAGGVGGLLSMSVFPPAASPAETYFHAFDGNGNVRALVKADAGNPAASAIAARYAYDGFGKEVAVTGADADKNAFRFSTKQLDGETGLNYYGYRFYAAHAGRWINRDPIAERGGLNVYLQCSNGLTQTFDVLGFYEFPVSLSDLISNATRGSHGDPMDDATTIAAIGLHYSAAVAGFDAARSFWGFDAYGEEIAARWYFGMGDLTLFNDQKWAPYLKSSDKLSKPVYTWLFDALRKFDAARDRPCKDGADTPFNDSTLLTGIAVGDGVNGSGYTWTNGANPGVNVRFSGKYNCCKRAFSGTLTTTWNDIIDPAGKDWIKAVPAIALAGGYGGAKDYKFTVSWSNSFTMTMNPFSASGWPYGE